MVKHPINDPHHKLYTMIQQKLMVQGAPAPQVAPPPPAPASPPFSTANAASPLSGTLHYGGSVNSRSGKLGPKPSAGCAFKAQKRLELIVRMENSGIPEAAMAAMLTISVPRLRNIKKSAAFLKARMRITHGLIIDQESSLAEVKEQRKEMLAQMLPDALQVIANVIRTPTTSHSQERLKVAVAQDLLDREGTFAKVSRSEIKTSPSFDWGSASTKSQSVLDIIRAAATQTLVDKADVQGVIELSQKFSNSHTLSAIDQEDAMVELERSILDGPSASSRIQ